MRGRTVLSKLLFSVLFVASHIAWSADPHVQSKACNSLSSPLTCAFTSNTAAGNLIVVSIKLLETAGSITTVTGTNKYVSAVTEGPHWGLSDAIYYSENIAGGAETVSVAFADSWAATISIHEYTGVLAAASLDKVASDSGGSGAGNSGAQTTTQDDELIFGAGISLAAMTGMEGSGFTARVNNVFAGGHLTEDRVVSSIGSYSASFQDNGNVWLVLMATFKLPAPPAGGRRRSSTGVR